MTPEDAERYILSRELFGMRFGLDRMRRLMTALGNPQLRFKSIHVVGTNGKSSTVRMTAAILAKHGLRTGAYLSPHLVSFAERIRVDDADIEPGEFAAAIQRAARAAELVDRSLVGDDRVTQFELLTAAAYSELARQGVEVAVIEAGLGGRYDATNVIPSRVQVLTSVGLEHTRWLGPTITAIATEKLDVVQPGGDARARVRAAPGRARRGRAGGCRTRGHDRARGRGPRGAADRARHLPAPQLRPRAGHGRGVPRRARPRGGRGGRRRDPRPGPSAGDRRAPADAARRRPQPRRDRRAGGVAARAVGRRPRPCGRGHLDPRRQGRRRDAVAAAPAVRRARADREPEPAGAAATDAPVAREPARRARRSEVIRDPRAALERARELAGPDGLVVATGSIYLVADLLRPVGAGRASML